MLMPKNFAMRYLSSVYHAVYRRCSLTRSKCRLFLMLHVVLYIGDEVLSSDTCVGMSPRMTSHVPGIPEQPSYKTLPVATAVAKQSTVSCCCCCYCCFHEGQKRDEMSTVVCTTSPSYEKPLSTPAEHYMYVMCYS